MCFNYNIYFWFPVIGVEVTLIDTIHYQIKSPKPNFESLVSGISQTHPNNAGYCHYSWLYSET